jgi:hypothetical protein
MDNNSNEWIINNNIFRLHQNIISIIKNISEEIFDGIFYGSLDIIKYDNDVCVHLNNKHNSNYIFKINFKNNELFNSITYTVFPNESLNTEQIINLNNIQVEIMFEYDHASFIIYLLLSLLNKHISININADDLQKITIFYFDNLKI